MEEEICLNCKFFVFIKKDFGYCKRYPTDLLKDIKDFCGEFRTKLTMLVEEQSERY